MLEAASQADGLARPLMIDELEYIAELDAKKPLEFFAGQCAGIFMSADKNENNPYVMCLMGDRKRQTTMPDWSALVIIGRSDPVR